MPWPVHPTGFFGARGDSDTYRIERSLRFNSADGPYLTRPFSTPTSSSKWTMSMWFKRGSISTGLVGLFGKTVNSGANFYIGINSNDTMTWTFTNTLVMTTNQVFRDPSSWCHLVAVWDSANSTAIQRARIYINGSEITSWSTDNRSSVTTSMDAWNTTNTSFLHAVGAISNTASTVAYNFDGHIAETYFIDGQALTPSRFGETDAITGRWKAKAYSGTYGTNGFYLKFADNSGTTATTLGKDSSGNGNNWTPNNFSVTSGDGNDSLVDSPTNYGGDSGVGGEVRGNYCVFTSIASNMSSGSITNGGLDVSTVGGGGQKRTSFSFTSGKWYWEITHTGGANPNAGSIGICDASATVDSNIFTTSGFIIYYAAGDKYINGTSSSYGSSYTTNDVIGIALDLDSGTKTISFYKNNTNQGSITISGITNVVPFVGSGSSTQNTTYSANFGQRPFAYTAPSGFKALCTQNLTQPTIQKPSTAMDVVTYTGTGASQSISSLGFSPDLVWIKGRSGATDHALYDVIRGSQARLESNTTDAEVTSDNGLTSFDSAGFTVGTLAQVNTNTATYVGWSWDAGSTNSTNTSGSITSTVRANPQAGFSIVSYSGNSTAGATVGHGLGVAPKMIIVFLRNASGGFTPVYHSSISNTEYLRLNSTSAKSTSPSMWNSTSPTSSVFTLSNGADVNGAYNYIAYCFAEIEGYSKFGSYTGNGSSDGPFVWCGFRPRWILFKRTDSLSHWVVYDTARNTTNPLDLELAPNNSNSENGTVSSESFDLLSNGFKIRCVISGEFNVSNATCIFAAFAEAPFKYARAR